MTTPDEWNERLWDYADGAQFGAADVAQTRTRVEEALANGADVNYELLNYNGDSMGSVLERAAQGGDKPTLRLLLDHGAAVTYDVLAMAFYEAAQLVQSSTDVRMVEESGGAEVYINRMVNAAEVADLLLAAAPKESFQGCDARGQTLLDIARPALASVREGLEKAMEKHGLTAEDLKQPSMREQAEAARQQREQGERTLDIMRQKARRFSGPKA